MALFSSRAPYIASMRGYRQPDTKRATMVAREDLLLHWIQPAVFLQNHYSAVVYNALLWDTVKRGTRNTE